MSSFSFCRDKTAYEMRIIEWSSDVCSSDLSGNAERLPLVFGVVFIVAGLAFKLAAAPFHMWTPDVYQGSPTSVTLILSAAPKQLGRASCRARVCEYV